MSSTVPDERVQWRSRLARFVMRVTPCILISLFFILFIIFGLFPLRSNGVVSLRTWRLDDPYNDGWAGISSYTQLLTTVTSRTPWSTPSASSCWRRLPQLMAALIIAGLLNRPLRARTFLRIGVLVPCITPIAATTLIFAFVVQDSQDSQDSSTEPSRSGC